MVVGQLGKFFNAGDGVQPQANPGDARMKQSLCEEIWKQMAGCRGIILILCYEIYVTMVPSSCAIRGLFS